MLGPFALHHFFSSLTFTEAMLILNLLTEPLPVLKVPVLSSR